MLPVKNSTNLMINDCVCCPSLPPSHPPYSHFSPSSANSKYLSGGLPRVCAVLNVSNPGVFLQRVNGFQDVLSPVFHLWKQPNSAITHWAQFKRPHHGTEQHSSRVNSARTRATSFSSNLFCCYKAVINISNVVKIGYSHHAIQLMQVQLC